ncbi:MAG: hypothetical protein WDO73_28830 [Ignavibacteriota bacterium]
MTASLPSQRFPPGSGYSLKVTRKGYADWELPSFDLSVGETLNFKIRLYADRAATPEQALGALAPVQDTKTAVASLVTEQQLADLPTAVRHVDPLVLLAPAVVQDPQGVLSFRGGLVRNVFLLDSLSITNNYHLYQPNVAPFIPQDAIGQIQVVSAAATPDLAHTMGGMINAVSKAGSNGLHASAYDYYARDAWDSPDFFATASSRAAAVTTPA